MKLKRLTLCGLLSALAIVLSLVERLFPLDAIVPIPGVKLGLANVITLFALTRLTARDALAIVICRVTLSSLMMGSITSFLFSMTGSVFTLVAMHLFLRLEGRFCSLVGVSIAGAAAHNIGQMLAAIFWMGTGTVIAYLPALLFMSIPLGFVTGAACTVIITHLKKIEFDV